MSLKLGSIVPEFLQKRPDQKFTARDIAEWVFENYPEECRKKLEESERLDSDAALIGQLVAEIGRERPRMQRKEPRIKTIEGKTKKYYYTESTDSDAIEQVEDMEGSEQEHISPTADSRQIKERDLYPILIDYMDSLSVWCKRIDEKKSSNSNGSGGNEWLHPDLVGMEDQTRDWTLPIKKVVGAYAVKKAKLWSFEVKKLINRSNVRRAFFQAVSNSSWANLGYLVAGEIEGEKTLKELRILSSLHGIGFIVLDVENPTESQIVIPAKEKNGIDWDTVNRLAQENNKNFLEYIDQVKRLQREEEDSKDAIIPERWDTIIEED